MLIFHGDSDNVLDYKWVKPDYEKYLKELPNFQFTLLKKLGHTVTIEELKESTAWIVLQLEKTGIKLL